MGDAEAQFARRDPPDQIGPLVRIRRVLDDPAAEHDGLEIGFERERLAELLHRDHGLDRAAAETAVLLRERRAEQAHFGVVAPEAVAEAVRRGQVGLPLFEAVPVLHQARDVVAQHLLLAREFEVHDQSPRMALAMMPR